MDTPRDEEAEDGKDAADASMFGFGTNPTTTTTTPNHLPESSRENNATTNGTADPEFIFILAEGLVEQHRPFFRGNLANHDDVQKSLSKDFNVVCVGVR